MTARRQYTIRSVPVGVDRLLRARARREGKSLNQVVIEVLSSSVGEGQLGEVLDDLDDLAGSWVEDDATANAIEEQRRIDEDLWR